MEMMLELLIEGERVLIDEIVDKIDIKTMEIVHKGDVLMVGPKKNIRQIQENNILIYSTGYIDTIDANIPIEKMLDIWKGEKEKLKKYVSNPKTSIKLCLTVNLSENPILYFSNEFIEFVSYLNAELEIDSYVEYDCEENIVLS